jgi:hypothetical protein
LFSNRPAGSKEITLKSISERNIAHYGGGCELVDALHHLRLLHFFITGDTKHFKQIQNSQIFVNSRLAWFALSGKINPTIFNSGLALCTSVTG